VRNIHDWLDWRKMWVNVRGLLWHQGRQHVDYSSAANRLNYVLPYVGSPIDLGLEDAVSEFTGKAAMTREAYIELLAAAFLKHTGADPSKVILVQENTITGVRFYFSKVPDPSTARSN
jgi:hypothetical protein